MQREDRGRVFREERITKGGQRRVRKREEERTEKQWREERRDLREQSI